jgi:hypothetical protein
MRLIIHRWKAGRSVLHSEGSAWFLAAGAEEEGAAVAEAQKQQAAALQEQGGEGEAEEPAGEEEEKEGEQAEPASKHGWDDDENCCKDALPESGPRGLASKAAASQVHSTLWLVGILDSACTAYLAVCDMTLYCK